MKVKTTNEIPKPARVFRVSPEDKAFIDKEFDALHEQRKMEWTTKPTPYAFPVFVVWHTVHLQGKEPRRKGRVVVDIRGLNKVSEFDAYSMPLQSDIISSIQGCKYISIMNCAAFFHQWRVAKEDRHKLTVITHRGSEQWNVAMMGWKNSPAYVQREMDGIFREYPYAKAYIDDVMIFSNSLKEHLNHFSTIFSLFQKWGITLKAVKTYLDYLSISLLGQKVDSFELATSADKLKAITELPFSRTLKDLKTYLDMTGYLRDYIPYYAQKSEPLHRRKTGLLKNGPVKGTARRNFNKGMILKEPNEEELKAYDMLQKDFSRSSWLTHFDASRVLYADIDASKKGFGVMIYHVKKNPRTSDVGDLEKKKKRSPQEPLSKRQVEPILFLSKVFTGPESRY